MVVGVGVAAAVGTVEVGVGFCMFLPIEAACAAMGWHAWLPARCFSAIITRARGSLSVLWAVTPAAIAPRLPDVIFLLSAHDIVGPISWCGSGCPGLSCRRVGPRRLPSVSPATRDWLTALWLVDPLPPFITHGLVRRARIFVHVAILRLIANPAVLHETVLIGPFCVPCLHEAAPGNGGHSIDQRALMLGPFRPNYLPLLVARSAFERLVLVTEVGFPFLNAWPPPLGGWPGTVASRATLRGPPCGGLAGFHLYRAPDNDISASDRDGVVLHVHFLLTLH